MYYIFLFTFFHLHPLALSYLLKHVVASIKFYFVTVSIVAVKVT